MDVKKCTKCGEVKSTIDFFKCSHLTSGLRSECKACTKKVQYVYRSAHRKEEGQRNKKYRKAHPEMVRTIRKRYKEAHPEKVKEMQTRYFKRVFEFVKFVKSKFPGRSLGEIRDIIDLTW